MKDVISDLCRPSFVSCQEKQKRIKKLFDPCLSSEAKYQKVIELGQALPPYPEELKTPERLVSGCQSVMYLDVQHTAEQTLRFRAGSEALISKGLAALLIAVYDGEPPEAVLRCPPHFLSWIGIHTSLTPGRSDGLASLLLKMKQEALKFLLTIQMPHPSSGASE